MTRTLFCTSGGSRGTNMRDGVYIDTTVDLVCILFARIPGRAPFADFPAVRRLKFLFLLTKKNRSTLPSKGVGSVRRAGGKKEMSPLSIRPVAVLRQPLPVLGGNALPIKIRVAKYIRDSGL